MMEGHDELRALLARIRRRWFVLDRAATRPAAPPRRPRSRSRSRRRPPGCWHRPGGRSSPDGASLPSRRPPRRWSSCAACRGGRTTARSRDSSKSRPVPPGLAPALCDTLVSAVRVIEAPDRHPGASPRCWSVARSVRCATSIPPRWSRGASLRRSALIAAAAARCWLVAVALAAPHLLRAGATAWVAWFPHTHSDRRPDRQRASRRRPVRCGSPPAVRGPRRATPVARPVAGRERERAAANGADDGGGDGFSYTIESVDRSFEYRVVAGSSSHRARTR